MLKENLENVEQKIQAACERSGRDRSEVTLIAVSKTKPAEMVQEAYDLGIRLFGENKVQEIMDKSEVLPADIHWHMIGHLQRNKIKYIIDKVDLIHSVDSLRLAEAIEKEAAKKHVIAKVLIEVNVGREESKFGFLPEEFAREDLASEKVFEIDVNETFPERSIILIHDTEYPQSIASKAFQKFLTDRK